MTTNTQPAAPAIAPVQQAERIQIVDILRGFALFGILLVNMAIFSQPFQAILFPADPDMPWYDWAATWLIHFLGEGKFYAHLLAALWAGDDPADGAHRGAWAALRALLHAAAAGAAADRPRPRLLDLARRHLDHLCAAGLSAAALP
jgi:hypothetical protein